MNEPAPVPAPETAGLGRVHGLGGAPPPTPTPGPDDSRDDDALYRKHIAAAERKYRAGSYIAAIGEYRRAIAIRSTPKAVVGLAQALYDANKPGEAIEQAERAIDASPRYAPAYLLLGSLYQDQGRSREARAAFQRYLELEPGGEHARDVREILARHLR